MAFAPTAGSACFVLSQKGDGGMKTSGETGRSGLPLRGLALQELQDDLIAQTHAICSEQGAPKFTDEQVEAYTTIGGTPFLDNQYTVFGEVEEGLDVVETIQNVATGRNDRPVDDVSMTVMMI